MPGWNPWHGCRKLSAGCRNCYVFRIDEAYDRDGAAVFKTQSFDLPLRRTRRGDWKVPSGETLYTCFTSDFLLEEADPWRPEAWEMMRLRADLAFFLITKRIDRFDACLPQDWGAGYPNVTICCTVENQDRADYRLPIYLRAPIRHKLIVCEPLLGPVDIAPYLVPQADNRVEQVLVGGESGAGARVCAYDWVLQIRNQCLACGVPFRFKQTGARFFKDVKMYRIPRKLQHVQARKAGIDL